MVSNNRLPLCSHLYHIPILLDLCVFKLVLLFICEKHKSISLNKSYGCLREILYTLIIFTFSTRKQCIWDLIIKKKLILFRGPWVLVLCSEACRKRIFHYMKEKYFTNTLTIYTRSTQEQYMCVPVIIKKKLISFVGPRVLVLCREACKL